MADPVTKINSEPTQSNINNLKNELAKCATKIKATKDIIKQGKKDGFLVIVVGLSKYKTIIRSPRTMLNEPDGLGPYDNSTAATDTTFARSKKEKIMQERKRSMRNT